MSLRATDGGCALARRHYPALPVQTASAWREPFVTKLAGRLCIRSEDFAISLNDVQCCSQSVSRRFHGPSGMEEPLDYPLSH